MVLNERKTYKDLLTERTTLEKDLRVAPQSTLKLQSSAADSEFVELMIFIWRRFRVFRNGMRNLE